MGTWIARQLPEPRRAYVEPCCGMLGVLLQRPKSPNEVVNDLDERIVTWWRMVRDQPEEFARRLKWTPFSRREYAAQRERLDDPDPMTRAVAVHVVISQGIMHSTRGGSWRPPSVRNTPPPRYPDIERLHARIADVHLECRDAVDLLERWSKEPDAVIYLDPPYESAYTDEYAALVDTSAAVEVLRRCRGAVAVSGYGSEWDALDWRRVEYPVFTPVGHGPDRGGIGSGSKRVEVLWCNFAAPQGSLF